MLGLGALTGKGRCRRKSYLEGSSRFVVKNYRETNFRGQSGAISFHKSHFCAQRVRCKISKGFGFSKGGSEKP